MRVCSSRNSFSAANVSRANSRIILFENTSNAFSPRGFVITVAALFFRRDPARVSFSRAAIATTNNSVLILQRRDSAAERMSTNLTFSAISRPAVKNEATSYRESVSQYKREDSLFTNYVPRVFLDTTRVEFLRVKRDRKKEIEQQSARTMKENGARQKCVPARVHLFPTRDFLTSAPGIMCTRGCKCRPGRAMPFFRTPLRTISLSFRRVCTRVAPTCLDTRYLSRVGQIKVTCLGVKTGSGGVR